MVGGRLPTVAFLRCRRADRGLSGGALAGRHSHQLFSDSILLKFPPKGFSLRWYAAFFNSPEWTASLWLSFKIGLATMAAATILGVGAALGLVQGAVFRPEACSTPFCCPP